MLTALVPWVLYAAFWHVSYSMRRDWDLFSPTGAVAAVAAAWFVIRPCRGDRTLAVRVAALSLFAFVPFVATNAGDRRLRRDFAVSATSVLGAFAEADGDLGPRARRAASVWLERGRSLDADGFLPEFTAGWELVRDGRHAEAVARLTDAVAHDPDSRRARMFRGMAHARLDHFDEARADFAAALPIGEEEVRAQVRYELAALLASRGDDAGAATHLLRSLRECSWNPRALDAARLLAACYRRLGNPAWADVDAWVASRRSRG